MYSLFNKNCPFWHFLKQKRKVYRVQFYIRNSNMILWMLKTTKKVSILHKLCRQIIHSPIPFKLQYEDTSKHFLRAKNGPFCAFLKFKGNVQFYTLIRKDTQKKVFFLVVEPLRV